VTRHDLTERGHEESVIRDEMGQDQLGTPLARRWSVRTPPSLRR